MNSGGFGRAQFAGNSPDMPLEAPAPRDAGEVQQDPAGPVFGKLEIGFHGWLKVIWFASVTLFSDHGAPRPCGFV
jgi:hypothetical protein